MDEAQARLDAFLDKYAPDVAALARTLLARMKARLPGAQILVYDNYNALAIGFAASERAADAVLSIALYPRWANLFFLQGATLPDPHRMLKGEGSRVRHVRLHSAEALDDPRVEALIAAALAQADRRIDPAEPQRLLIKSISAKQRPRRPR
jgi:hypothetical protein